MIGTKLGPYEILEEIGKGGMATVYRAYQPSVDRYVAVKVMKQGIAGDPEALARFQREARLIARLEHPHLLPVFDFDSNHDPPYIVMRYLESGTLKDMIARCRLPLQEIGFLLRQAATALDYAHRQGVIHRDIKPSNIMIDGDGNVFVADFGIARLAVKDGTESGGLTQTGAMVGTPHYMAPEQAMGHGDIDHRADIYSLGVVLFELLTGKLPYTADTPMGIAMAHVNNPVPKPSTVEPKLPAILDEVVAKAMAKEPAARYDKVSDFARAACEALGPQTSEMPVRLRSEAQETISVVIKDRQKREGGHKASRGGEPVAHGKTSKIDTDSRATPTEQTKQLTVLHANLADLTEAMESQEAESARDIMDRIWTQMEKVIEEHGGLLESRTRDTALALWGVETAREDDPEKAIRAALEIKQAVLESLHIEKETEDNKAPIQIGITTGAVLLTHGDHANKYSATGATIGLAGRLERITPSGSILISHDTYRHVQGVFNMEPSDPLRIREGNRLLETYIVNEAKPRAFRIASWGVEGIETPMVGREAELKHLKEAFYTVTEDKEARIVTIVSDPGIGKSRLLYEFDKWNDLQEAFFRFFKSRGTPEMSQRPYSLLRHLFQFRFEIMHNDPPERVREKMETGVADLMKDCDADRAKETAHFIGQLAGFDFSMSRYLSGFLDDARQFQEHALRHLGEFFIAVGKTSPILIELEDIHWSDDASLDAFSHLISKNPQLPILLICLARPEFYKKRHTWGKGQTFHSRLELTPLSKREARRMVQEILVKVKEIPDKLRDLIVERAEGNPFYIEETTRALIEDRIIIKDDAQWHVELDRLSEMHIPSTLTGLIQARLDSLFPSERAILQRASVMGRIFWDSGLLLLEKADSLSLDVPASLRTLAERELIHLREESSLSPAKEYVFASTILRDVVYESIPARRRRGYHNIVAHWLIENCKGRSGENAGLIAEHFEKAGEKEEAVDYFKKAGEEAFGISAFAEALSFFNRALTLTLADKSLSAKEAFLRTRLGEVHFLMGAYKEAKATLDSAITIARASGNKAAQANALHLLAQVEADQKGPAESLSIFENSLALALETGDKTVQAWALQGLGSANRLIGSLENATEHYIKSLAIAKELGDTTLVLTALTGLGVVARMKGNFDGAKKYYEECREMAISLENRDKLSIVLNNLGEVHRHQGDYISARAYYKEAMEIAEKIGKRTLVAIIWANLGSVASKLGDREEAVRLMKNALKEAKDINYTRMMLEAISELAKLQMDSQDKAKAVRLFGIVLNHPATDAETKQEIEFLLVRLQKEMGKASKSAESLEPKAPILLVCPMEEMGEKEFQKRLEEGKSLDLDAAITDLLQ